MELQAKCNFRIGQGAIRLTRAGNGRRSQQGQAEQAMGMPGSQ